jgi:hypothetical protein
LVPRNGNHLLRVARSQDAPYVLSNAGRHANHIAARVVAGDVARRERIVLVARSGARLSRMAPDVAQHISILPNGQCEHDRKNDCSKHVTLAIPHRKNEAKNLQRFRKG